MKRRTASCPTCGAPVEFQLSTSLVSVCEFCQTVVARGDKSVEDHGKVADLVLTDSPIKRGMTGKFRGKSFEVIGRVQYQHPAGGVWDEWYLLFPSGRWGWLAEAQGKYMLTTQKNLPQSTSAPAHEDIEIGQRIELSKGTEFVVSESGVAHTLAAEGEIPWDFRPQMQHPFVDLQGPDGAFATLDYSEDSLKVFIGRELQIQELGLQGDGWEAGYPTSGPRVEAKQVSCPQCGGTLTLHVPDETLRVGCPNCRSLLSCEEGNLTYLQTLKTKSPKPRIPLGQRGKFKDVDYTVIGFMGRYVRYEGRTYPWTEYLLHNPKVGYRWLVESKKHWSFVEPVSAGDVVESGNVASYKKLPTFKIYERSTAFVRFVFGEFYWQVTSGEQVRTADYISPPHMLSFERSGSKKSGELNISLGTYVTPDEIEQAFGVKDLHRPFGVGPIQPKARNGSVFMMWIGFIVLTLIMYGVFNNTITGGVNGPFLFLILFLLSVMPICVGIYNYSFEVQRWRDSDYSPYSTE